MRLVYHCSLPPRTAFQQDEVTEPRKRGVGKGDPPTLLVGTQNGAATVDNSLRFF